MRILFEKKSSNDIWSCKVNESRNEVKYEANTHRQENPITLTRTVSDLRHETNMASSRVFIVLCHLLQVFFSFHFFHFLRQICQQIRSNDIVYVAEKTNAICLLAHIKCMKIKQFLACLRTYCTDEHMNTFFHKYYKYSTTNENKNDNNRIKFNETYNLNALAL